MLPNIFRRNKFIRVEFQPTTTTTTNQQPIFTTLKWASYLFIYYLVIMNLTSWQNTENLKQTDTSEKIF